MKRLFPAFVVSLLLHVGVFLLAFISWQMSPKPRLIDSVPVTIVTEVPSQEMAAAPVDALAVKPPAPVPAPEEPVKPAPVPAPPQPVPVPVKPAAKPAVKPTPVPPDKNGLKKPAPEKPALDLDALAASAAPSKAKTRTPAQANTHPTNGASNSGAAPADTGKAANDARAELGRRIMALWNPNCDGGGDQVVLKVKVWPSHGGRILRAPQWLNPSGADIWEAGFARARSAIAQVDTSDIVFADGDYSDGISLRFDAVTACKNQ